MTKMIELASGVRYILFCLLDELRASPIRWIESWLRPPEVSSTMERSGPPLDLYRPSILWTPLGCAAEVMYVHIKLLQNIHERCLLSKISAGHEREQGLLRMSCTQDQSKQAGPGGFRIWERRFPLLSLTTQHAHF